MNDFPFSRRHAEIRIHYAPEAGLIYLNNPKVACSSIKQSLWLYMDTTRGRSTYAGNPHSPQNNPFLRQLGQIERSGFDRFLASESFSVVRNPFARLLSAYLNKVAAVPRDKAVWHPIAARFGWRPGERPPFGEFLERIAEEEPVLLDHHFCPQHLNLLRPLVSPAFVGRLEDLGETISFLQARGIAWQPFSGHATNAGTRINDYYSDLEISLAHKIYGLDFSLYGYSDDPAQLQPIRPVELGEPAHSRLRELIHAPPETPRQAIR